MSRNAGQGSPPNRRYRPSPRRKYPPIDLKQADEILHKLVYLAGYDTEPIGNPNSEILKDEKAREALILAGRLIGPLITWAVNHEAGQLRLKHSPSVPRRPHRLKNPEKFEALTRKRNMAANSHDNERVGAAYHGRNQRLNRQIAAAVLGLISRGMGFQIGRQLGGALQALDQGEVAEMLKPEKNSRMKAAASLDEVKLAMLEHVYFLWGAGKKKHQAIDEVATSLNVGVDTLKQWEKRDLPSTLDQDWITERLEAARIKGVLASALENEEERSKLLSVLPVDFEDPADLKKAKNIVSQFSHDRLNELRVRFNKLRSDS